MRPQRSFTPMMIENLENRLLLTSTLVNGTLTLTSTVLGETFIVNATATTVTVEIVGETFQFTYPKGSVQRLVINSNPDNNNNNRAGDTILVSPTVTFPTTITGSGGDDIIEAGSGDTTIDANGGAD